MSKSEAQTRSELIDQYLAQSGRNVKDPTQVVEEFDIFTGLPEGVEEPRTPYDGHQFSGYVLLGKDRKPLAVQEVQPRCRHRPRASEAILLQHSEAVGLRVAVLLLH
jgi:type I restriction enzyme R subunit